MNYDKRRRTVRMYNALWDQRFDEAWYNSDTYTYIKKIDGKSLTSTVESKGVVTFTTDDNVYYVRVSDCIAVPDLSHLKRRK